mmetsp:Transcript_50567/g.110681  ORF Transcript_50567/g.110681 Transcript_50567/m.110681 type:complete len:1056 (+) Transcript_50567:88-3255(+)
MFRPQISRALTRAQARRWAIRHARAGVTTTRKFGASAQLEKQEDPRVASVRFRSQDNEVLARLEATEQDWQRLRGLKTVELEGTCPETKRAEIRQYFHDTFDLFEKLHSIMASPVAFFIKHEKLRHPPIFYVGHTASFYVNKLLLGKFIDGSQRIDPVVEMQTAVGVDEMAWDDLDAGHYAWPSGEEAMADPDHAREFLNSYLDFRARVRDFVDERIAAEPLTLPIKHDSFWYVLIMGIEHERIHFETSSVILRQAPLNLVQPSPVLPVCPSGTFSLRPEEGAAPTNELLPVAAGTTRQGRLWETTKLYGWDNEFSNPVAEIPVESFEASKYLVSNAEFLEFVRAGGYQNQKYWDEEGWKWASESKCQMPRFWRCREGAQGEEWTMRTMYSELPMPWNWPAEVSNLEAAAFCRFKSEQLGKVVRLPTEDEHNRLRDLVPTDQQTSEHGPAWAKGEAPGNVNLEYWASSCPVNKFVDPSSGFADILGNVWQHSTTAIDVFPGFRTHPLYDDFTTPTVDGMHGMILGGSWASTGADGATRDSRYAFRKHFYQHAGLRYVAGPAVPEQVAVPYETDRSLCAQFRFHFDTNEVTNEVYPVVLAERVAAGVAKAGGQLGRVLEVGCGPGRTALEIAGRFAPTEMVATDLTARAFEFTAQKLLSGPSRLRWTNVTEGDHIAYREIRPAELGPAAEAGKAIRWVQTPDPAELDLQKLGVFDVVVAAQPGVLGRMPNLEGFLGSVHEAVVPGGLLFVGCAEEKEIAGGLAKWFELVAEEDVPFGERETIRKYAYGVQHLTTWRRRAAPAEAAASTAAAATSTAEFSGGQEIYDDNTVLRAYLDFHFGSEDHLGVPNFPRQCAEMCVAAALKLGAPMGSAAEVGCGPGRAAFELAKGYGRVHGVDLSSAFVNAAEEMRTKGDVQGFTVDSETSRDALSFAVADACNLPAAMTNYDLICGFNLIDRLPDPEAFLRSLPARVNPGGLVILASPYTWLETFTPKDKWLGGYKYGDNDSPKTHEALRELMPSLGFEEAQEAQDVEFVIRDGPRKYQRTKANFTVWRKA